MMVFIPKGSAVYIRYEDHGLNQTIPDAAERETLGWLTKEVGDFICIEHDRTIESLESSSETGNGIFVRKNCILEVHVFVKKESK